MSLRVKNSVTTGTAFSMSATTGLCIQETYVRAYNDLYVDGDFGVGTTSPNYKLDVNGTARISGNVRGDSFEADAELKTVYSTVVKHGGDLAMDDFTWRRVFWVYCLDSSSERSLRWCVSCR